MSTRKRSASERKSMNLLKSKETESPFTSHEPRTTPARPPDGSGAGGSHEILHKKDLRRAGRELNHCLGQAIRDFGLIRDGEKIAVAVSGGADSLSLFSLLSARRHWAAVRYKLVPIHVRMRGRSLSDEQLDTLIDFIGMHDAALQVVDTDLSGGDPGRKPGELSCFWCAWKRRKALFTRAGELACGKVALGHHKDDLVQTFLMNLFFNGSISTMPPRLELFQGALTLIRPFAYAGKDLIRRFATEVRIPVFESRCPVAPDSRRVAVSELIVEMKKRSPQVVDHIFHGLQNVKEDYLPTVRSG